MKRWRVRIYASEEHYTDVEVLGETLTVVDWLSPYGNIEKKVALLVDGVTIYFDSEIMDLECLDYYDGTIKP